MLRPIITLINSFKMNINMINVFLRVCRYILTPSLVKSVNFDFGQNGFFLPLLDVCAVQIVLIAESRRLQASLSTYGVVCQTPDEIEPVQIWSQWDMVKVFEKLGQTKKVKLSGRPPRPIGALGSSKIYRVSGQTVMTYPLTFSATEFYISHDLALLTDHIRCVILDFETFWLQIAKF